MNISKTAALFWAVFILYILSCGHEHRPDTHTYDEQGHSHDGDTHSEHADEMPVQSFTVWTDKSELFVEFPTLIVGRESRFAAHLTNMGNFKPVQEGELTVRLRTGDRIANEDKVSGPSSPGIFRPVINPVMVETYVLDFLLQTSQYSDTISISGIRVYPTEEAALNSGSPESEGDEISFLKEQAWKIDFAIARAEYRPFRAVIHTSGEIQPVKGAARIVTSRRSGIVFFTSQQHQVGIEVSSGQPLFSITSEGMVSSNMREKFLVAKARLDKANSDFERAESLLEDQIIGQKEYENRKMEFEIAQAEFRTLSNVNQDGQIISAPISGIIKNIFIGNGQFVNEGSPLIEITRNRKLLIKAEVSQKYYNRLSSIETANFRASYHTRLQFLGDYNGRMIPTEMIIDEVGGMIPVYFELDNIHNLIPGTYVEMYLLTSPVERGLTVPKTAVMQDYTQYHVYVQSGGESFEKREVKLGVDDGENIQVLSGINEGEWIVTRGAYQIKMASMSAVIPAHGHEH